MGKPVDRTIRSLRGYLREADKIFFEQTHGRSSYEYPEAAIEYYIEKAFMELLILLESLNLSNTYDNVRKLYEEAKDNKNGLNAIASGQYDPYLIWPERIDDYIDAIANIHDVESDEKFESSSLIDVIRNSVIPITDSKVFGGPPKNEKELHLRLEAILRSIYPTLFHEPPLLKPIKSFRPDTGIRSLRTLIEYKYISSQAESKRVVDEILADRAGYSSREWKRFLFVIYETKRIKHEKEWEQLIRESDISSNTKIVVLPGVPKDKKRIKKDS